MTLQLIQKCKKCEKEYDIPESIFCSVECALDYVLNKEEII